ncbi:MAG: hypothetical protein E7E64_16690, partial [Clostridium celatum]|nr:hypothetical protein [Clostridium celatum]
MKNKIITTVTVGIIILLSTFGQIKASANVLTKTQTGYKDSTNKNSFPETINYDDGEYYGTLSKNGSPTVISGTYTAEKTKYVYGTSWHDRPVREREFFSGYQESPLIEGTVSESVNLLMSRLGSMGVSYRTSWTWDGGEGDNPKEWYSDSEGYSGYLTKINQDKTDRYIIGWGTEYWKYPASKKGEPRPPLVVYWRTDKAKLEGPVTKPAIDTRVYRQNYSGIVKKRDTIPPVIKVATYGWTALNSINITVNAIDDLGSGVSNIKLYDSKGVQLKSVNLDTLTYTYTPTVEGIIEFSAKAMDFEGNTSNLTKFTVKIDKTAPMLSGIPSSNWTNKDVEMKLISKDKLSGINSFLLKNGTEIIKSGTVSIQKDTATIEYTLTEEGIYNYKVYSEDNADNPAPRNSKEESFSVKIDKTAPTITGDYSYGWTNEDVTISQNASDILSGVNRIELYNSSGTKLVNGTSLLSYKVTTEGNTVYTVKAYDNADNVSNKEIRVKIDKVLPQGIFTPNSSGWRNTNLTVNFDPSDTGGSGVKQWRYAISNNNGSTYGNWSSYIVGDTTSNITLTEEGTNKIKVEVTDNAGNLNTVTSGSYQIDKTAPIATSYDVVDRQDDTFTIDIVGVSDNGGSGVKSQTVKVW